METHRPKPKEICHSSYCSLSTLSATNDSIRSILHVALYKLLNRPLSEDLPKQRLQSEDDICGLLALLLNNGLSIDEEIVFRGRFNIFGEAWVLRLVRQTITHLPDYQRHGSMYINDILQKQNLIRFLAIELSEALEAIYLQDEKMLKKALERHPESVNQPFPWNRTLLYKSLIWPRGMSILLAAGAAGAADRDILEHACYLENVSAISLLLNHECPITWLGPICKINNLEIQKLVVYHLTRRRKRLRDLTVGTLSDTELQTLNLGEDRLLDAQADVAIAVLSRNGIKVAPALLPYTLRRTTVYHCVPLNIELANLLYDAGFRDCDELNAHGMSPFWAHVQGDVWNPLEKLPFLAWLRSKGVDIYRRHPVGRMMATHAVGRLLGDSRLWYDMRRMSSEQEEQASLFLGDDTTDDCDCACSRTGCQALAFALADCGPFTHPFRCNPEIDINFSCCLQLLQLVNSHVFENQWIPSKAIRAMSFSCLELTHTCHASLILWQCDRLSVKAPMSMDEIGEIQEEEYSLIQQLEDLVDEFEAKFHELGIPLIQFLVECWKPRMEEVLKVNSEQKEAEERRMRELGIIVRRDSGVEEIEDTEDVETEDEDEVSAGDDEG